MKLRHPLGKDNELIFQLLIDMYSYTLKMLSFFGFLALKGTHISSLFLPISSSSGISLIAFLNVSAAIIIFFSSVFVTFVTNFHMCTPSSYNRGSISWAWKLSSSIKSTRPVANNIISMFSVFWRSESECWDTFWSYSVFMVITRKTCNTW